MRNARRFPSGRSKPNAFDNGIGQLLNFGRELDFLITAITNIIQTDGEDQIAGRNLIGQILFVAVEDDFILALVTDDCLANGLTDELHRSRVNLVARRYAGS